jgi:hypothetical protein
MLFAIGSVEEPRRRPKPCSSQLRRVLSTILVLDREFRVGFTTLGALSGQEVVNLLVERSAMLTIAHEEVKSTHLLSMEQLARLR